MAYVSYNSLWKNEFDNLVSKKDKVQDMNINQLKLEVHDTYKKMRQQQQNFETVHGEDVINKAYLDEKLSKIDGHLSILEKDYTKFKILSNKQSIEEVLIQRAVKTTIQKFYDKKVFDNYANVLMLMK